MIESSWSTRTIYGRLVVLSDHIPDTGTALCLEVRALTLTSHRTSQYDRISEPTYIHSQLLNILSITIPVLVRRSASQLGLLTVNSHPAMLVQFVISVSIQPVQLVPIPIDAGIPALPG